MKHLLLLLFIAVISIAISAQTKWIAHKSHSGSMENYRAGLEHNWSDEENSNFGARPEDFGERLMPEKRALYPLIPEDNKLFFIKDSVIIYQGFMSKHPPKNTKDSLLVKDSLLKAVKHGDSLKVNTPGLQKKENQVLPVSTGNKGPGAQPPLVLLLAVIGMVSLATGLVYYKYQQLKSGL